MVYSGIDPRPTGHPAKMPTPDKDKPAKKPPPKKKPAPRKRPGGQKPYKPAKDVVMNVPQPDPREEARLQGMAACDAYGIDQVVDDILNQVPLMHIAMKIGVPLSAFYRWTDRAPGVSERMHEARKKTAQGWEELAEQVLAEAKNPFELMRAKELAHHYRWRAACISPKYNPTKADDKPNTDPVAAMQELARRLPN